MSNRPDKMVPADQMDPKTLRRYAVRIDHMVRINEAKNTAAGRARAAVLREVRVDIRAVARELEKQHGSELSVQ